MVLLKEIVDELEKQDFEGNVYVFCDEEEVIDWFKDMKKHHNIMNRLYTYYSDDPSWVAKHTDIPCLGYCIYHTFYPYTNNIKIIHHITPLELTELDLNML